MRQTFQLLVFILLVVSCEENKKVNIPYKGYSTESVLDTITIMFYTYPETTRKYVAAKINGFETLMLVDTGSSSNTMSCSVKDALFNLGLLSANDSTGLSISMLADGSTCKLESYNIKTLELSNGEKTLLCKNVRTVVPPNENVTMLLGNCILDRFASYTIDNEHQTITFNLKNYESKDISVQAYGGNMTKFTRDLVKYYTANPSVAIQSSKDKVVAAKNNTKF